MPQACSQQEKRMARPHTTAQDVPCMQTRGPEAVAGFITGDKGGGHVIRNYIKENSSSLKIRTVASPSLRHAGDHHCLKETYDRGKQDIFCRPHICRHHVGKNRHRRRARRITLGSFCRANNTIRINPLLDRKSVPLFFLEFIVYHEMLHADLGFTAHNGRRRLHTKEFRTRERLFAGYDRPWPGRRNTCNSRIFSLSTYAPWYLLLPLSHRLYLVPAISFLP